MICQKCGALVDDSLNKCDNCGYVFEEAIASPETDGSEYNINPNTPALADAFRVDKNKSGKKFTIVFALSLLAALSVVVLTFYGTHYMALAGKSLNQMQGSMSSFFGFGSGVDSSYYVYLGAVFYGLAYALRGIGVAFASIIVLLGLKKGKKGDEKQL